MEIDLIEIPVELFEAFRELYAGLQDASTNGTGYSPRIAAANKRIAPYTEVVTDQL
jgi:hypothetical protein